MRPKPVNATLNRDMLGLILAHARTDMADEVNKMTFTTLGDMLTLAQAREYLQQQLIYKCPVASCGCIFDRSDEYGADYWQCNNCKRRACFEHTFCYSSTDVYLCANCKVNQCPMCDREYQFNDDGITIDDCGHKPI